MTSLESLLSWLPDRLEALVAEYKVPGMAVGVLKGGERFCRSIGVTHVDLQYPVLPGTVFQIGSNTKLLTATAAMLAVEHGLLELDEPVVAYLQSFALANPVWTRQVTVRQLMTHTSGIDGDFSGPKGFSPDVMERYAAAMVDVGFLHQPGKMWSYCNAGWALLGRVLEVVFASTFPQLMHQNVFAPLGMTSTFILPEDILTTSAAMGHLPDQADMSPKPAPVYVQAPGCAPAGSVPASTIGDVLTFIEMHLSDGIAADGTRFLKSSSVAAMQHSNFAIPSLGHIKAMGLGWMLGETTDGQRMLAHGGGTLGQVSLLEVVPDQKVAVVTLSNAFGGGLVGLELVKQVLATVADVQLPAREGLPEHAPKVDLGLYCGVYQRAGTTVEITTDGTSLRLVVDEEPLVPEARTAPPVITVQPADPETFVSQESGAVVRFSEFDDEGRPTFLFNFRLLRRC